jgi:hypothetical protein
MTKLHKKLVHEGEYAAEVEVELITADDAWSPYLLLEDAERLDTVREALCRGDVRAASREARVYHLTPVSA